MQAHRTSSLIHRMALAAAITTSTFTLPAAHAGLLGGGGSGSLGGSLNGSLNGALRQDPNPGQRLRKLTDDSRTLKDGATDKARDGAAKTKDLAKDGSASLQDKAAQGGDKLQAASLPALDAGANGSGNGSGQLSSLTSKPEDKATPPASTSTAPVPATPAAPAATAAPAAPALPAATRPSPGKERAVTGSATGSANGEANASRQGVSTRGEVGGRGEGSAKLQR